MPSIDDFLDRYQGPVEEVPICGRPDLIAEFQALEQEIIGDTVTESLAGPPADKLERLRALQTEIDDSVMVVRLQGIGFAALVALEAEHPPTPEDKAKGYATSPATFEPAVIAACAVDPAMTVEQATRLREKLPPSEWIALVTATARLHHRGHEAPKSLLLSGPRRPNVESSEPPPDSGSDDHGSLADPAGQ